MIYHLELNHLLTDDQCGFHSCRSCSTQLTVVLEQWPKILDDGHGIDCLYLNFCKQFDSVPHQRLLTKMRANGIEGRLIKWIEEYLAGRRQQVVVVNGKTS